MRGWHGMLLLTCAPVRPVRPVPVPDARNHTAGPRTTARVL
jgi:hypothetical protein